MADKNAKNEGNVPGAWYVDTNCIDCDLCRETAPNNFKQDAAKGITFLYKQPSTPAEVEACKEAKDGCSVDAIGDDG